MNEVLFYSFKIENVDFQSNGNLSLSTPFAKKEVIEDLKQKLAASGYKMMADNSQKIVRINNELFIEGLAYSGNGLDYKAIGGYFNSTN